MSMDKNFKKILDKYGIAPLNEGSNRYLYNGCWILDYYGKNEYSKNECFALMTKVNINYEFVFTNLERVRMDYTPKELDFRINELIVELKKLKMKKKFDEIKEDFV